MFNSVNGFKTTGIIPLNSDAIADFGYLSEENHETETGFNDYVVNPNSQTTSIGWDSEMGLPVPSISSQSTDEVITPTKLLEKISLIPNVNAVKTLKRKPQKIVAVLNSSENIAAIKNEKEEKKKEKEKSKNEKIWKRNVLAYAKSQNYPRESK
ncbi:hypothetical protein QE152_g13809 [Popillia japonica]|uniref:Uncharacterized protein n=1 Tax=Popillia japonica TaxID=7064 RepID=A0AAW1L8I7_POPJA